MSATETTQEFINVFEKQPQQNTTKKDRPIKKEPTSYASWPILLAIIPAFGTFIAGNADIWSDFVMLTLILYYVYKWMTGIYIPLSFEIRN